MMQSCVVFVDMITIVKLGFIGRCCCWIYTPGDAIAALAM
jgi:hypothetical protein